MKRHSVTAHAGLDTAKSATSELKDFYETLKSTLKAPKSSDFEPQALAKELADTQELGKRGEVRTTP